MENDLLQEKNERNKELAQVKEDINCQNSTFNDAIQQLNDEIDDKIPPYPGPSSYDKNWSPIFTHDGRWIDIFDNRICGSNGQTQSIPILYKEITTGLSCAYISGNSWKYNSYSIDIDNDNYGHAADAFPYDISQQIDTDLEQVRYSGPSIRGTPVSMSNITQKLEIYTSNFLTMKRQRRRAWT